MMNIPYNYARCMADEGRCPLADKCLRHLTWKKLTEQPASVVSVMTVSPFNPDIHYATEQCTMYRLAEQQCFARGMMGLYDNVDPHLRSWVRDQVRQTFPSERAYYYCREGKYLISPAQREKVVKVFQQCKLEVKPKFDDEYMDYDWK